MRRLVIAASLFAACLAGFASLYAADKDADSPKAAATRKLLKTKITVSFSDTPLSDVVDEIKDQVKEKTKKTMSVLKDNKGGVSNNTKFTYKADDKPLEEILDEMFKKNDLGYIVVSQKGSAYDGALKIVKGKARGYEPKKD
jgi:type II secretory pathway component GspD/PulD (secretin)